MSDRGGQVIAVGRTYEATFTGEIEQSRIEGRLANGTQGAQLGCGNGTLGVAEDAHDAFIQGGLSRNGGYGGGLTAQLQRQGFSALRELEMDRRQRRGSAMFGSERELISGPTQVEIAVTPRMELRGAAQRLTLADTVTTLFHMVNDEHGEVMTPLQLA